MQLWRQSSGKDGDLTKTLVAALKVHDAFTNCYVIMAKTEATVRETEQLMLVSESNTTPVSPSPFMSFQNTSLSIFFHVIEIDGGWLKDEIGGFLVVISYP